MYDADEGQMSSQLRFVKHGLGIEMMRQHPAKLVREVTEYCQNEEAGWLAAGEVELYHMTSEMSACPLRSPLSLAISACPPARRPPARSAGRPHIYIFTYIHIYIHI